MQIKYLNMLLFQVGVFVTDIVYRMKYQYINQPLRVCRDDKYLFSLTKSP